jgi:MFS family permease
VLARAVARAKQRLLPMLVLMYVMAFLDRVNVGFAKSALQADTGLANAAYALGAGMFFLGYAALEIPSNLMLLRFGARVWLGRIMITWGFAAAAMMFVQGPHSFIVLRFILGAAEAGFFPGVILYLTQWFPDLQRTRALGLFYVGLPLAQILGGPLAGALLEMDGTLALHGWQWLFLVEGLLACVVGVAALGWLTDSPADASWLDLAERNRLITELRSQETARRAAKESLGAAAPLRSLRILGFCTVYLTIQAGVYGLSFYLPEQIAALSGMAVGVQVGLLSAIPWLCALAILLLLRSVGDLYPRYRVQLCAGLLATAAVGIAASAAFASVTLAFAALCLVASGLVASQIMFWTLPSATLAGPAAAVGLALINSFGNVGGFLAPVARNWMENRFQSATAGLFLLATVALFGACLVLAIGAADAKAAK